MKKVRVLHLSTHNEDCGIGKYQEMFLEAMHKDARVENEFFELSPNQIKVMGKADYEQAFQLLRDSLVNFDILHIQHEYSFYWNDELERAVAIAQTLGKKVMVTIHTSANVAHQKAHLSGVGPRSLMHYARALRTEKKFFTRFIEPLKKVDLILVHNEVTKQSLTSRGVSESIIKKIIIPVPEVKHDTKSTLIKNNLQVKQGDVVYATVGFLHRYKGIKQAIKALQYLPKNYKLAIIGGLHPGTDDIEIYDALADLITELDMKDRVYITGYISDDDAMNAAIRECDICVFPYDNEYYSNVSSAALNNAFANYTAVVAYPTESFKEINDTKEAIVLTQTFAYYELARSLQEIDLTKAAEQSKQFARAYSYPLVSEELAGIYVELAA